MLANECLVAISLFAPRHSLFIRRKQSMRRKEGALTTIEAQLLVAARALEDTEAKRLPVPSATVYRALDRLESIGLLISEMGDPALAEVERRLRRRLYRLTAI